jgi:hypothetical protein
MERRVALKSMAEMAVVLWRRRTSVKGEGGSKGVKLGKVSKILDEKASNENNPLVVGVV